VQDARRSVAEGGQIRKTQHVDIKADVEQQGEDTDPAHFAGRIVDPAFTPYEGTFEYLCWKVIPSDPVLVGIHVVTADEEGTPVTVGKIRDLPLVRWETVARANVIVQYSTLINDQPNTFDALDPAGRVDLLYPGLSGLRAPAAKRKYRSLLHMAEVAHDYRQKQLAGVTDPAGAIARERDTNPSTVRSWIHRARLAGLLDGQRQDGGPL
jgi:hypothetical protein